MESHFVDDAAVQADAQAALDGPSGQTIGRLVLDTEPLLTEAPLIAKEAKAGYKTTEFWATAVTAFVTAIGVVPTPHNAKGYIVAALVGIYAVARGIAKHGQPNVEVDPSV
jgi:hypothetical protein